MKRGDLIRHLNKHDCFFSKEGSNHSTFKNAESGRLSSVPGHHEINDFTANKICKDLGIPKPRSR